MTSKIQHPETGEGTNRRTGGIGTRNTKAHNGGAVTDLGTEKD